jgi:hypothetical protein
MGGQGCPPHKRWGNWRELLLEICISFYCGGGQKIQLAVIFYLASATNKKRSNKIQY